MCRADTQLVRAVKSAFHVALNIVLQLPAIEIMSGNGERQKRAASAGVAKLSKQASEKWDVLDALPPVEGCAPARAASSFAVLRRKCSRRCLCRRKTGGPTRKSTKGGWTPEEVRGEAFLSTEAAVLRLNLGHSQPRAI